VKTTLLKLNSLTNSEGKFNFAEITQFLPIQKRSDFNYAEIRHVLPIQKRSEINFAEIRRFLPI
jgi:hypothetical protein